ncbi:FAD-dependent oxidoreductase [Eubacterium sp.]|uniref:FAD-dependent oxidoreductase n=1 Tax=Eubacterium sp. TaxID=142586 RepID=UPI002FC9D2DA
MAELEFEILKILKEDFPELDIKATVDTRRIATLSGECSTWQQLIDVGHHIAAIPSVKNIVSHMTVRGMDIPRKDYTKERSTGLKKGNLDQADVVIIGGGVIGCAIARELAKYELDIVVVEKNDDVCTGASKANNGNIHPGHAVKKGTLKARLNILGNRMYDQWADELNFEFQRNGLMYIAWEEAYIPALEERYRKGVENGVDGIALISGEEAIAIEPKLKELPQPPIAALWLPSLAHVEPYDVTVALAENAAENGVRFRFNTTVCDVLRDGAVKGIVTSEGIIHAHYVINCAGVYADDISAMAGDPSFTIHPRKGTIILMDKSKPYPYTPQLGFVSSALEERMHQLKNTESKGGGCCRTPEGNYLLGPSAKEVWDKEDTGNDVEGIEYALSCNQHPGVDRRDIIRIFTGVRPADFKEDFIIEMSPVTPGFINVAGIQSPGLAAAPAIARMVEDILMEDLEKKERYFFIRSAFNPHRKKRPVFRKLSPEEKQAIIKEKPQYGKIVCRCETITEGEILDALDSPVVPRSIEAIKRRTRAGMGRCQGGFCQPRVVEILAKYFGEDWSDIRFSELGTTFLKKTKK